MHWPHSFAHSALPPCAPIFSKPSLSYYARTCSSALPHTPCPCALFQSPPLFFPPSRPPKETFSFFTELSKCCWAIDHTHTHIYLPQIVIGLEGRGCLQIILLTATISIPETYYSRHSRAACSHLQQINVHYPPTQTLCSSVPERNKGLLFAESNGQEHLQRL